MDLFSPALDRVNMLGNQVHPYTANYRESAGVPKLGKKDFSPPVITKENLGP